MYYHTNSLIFLDGKIVKATGSPVDLYSQTLHYGYGVLEGIRSYSTKDGEKMFKGYEHYVRLKRSAEALNIPFDYTVSALLQITEELLERNNLHDAYIRPLVFCGPNMGLGKPTSVSFMIAAGQWDAYLSDQQLKLLISSYCRPHPRSLPVEAKVCGHYVNSILATREAKEAGYDEALLLDTEGYLAEGPGANLFFEKNDELFTPQCGNILPGITRATVIELAETAGLRVHEGRYHPDLLFEADSAFYCGTAAEIVGIKSINGHSFEKNWNSTIGFQIQQSYQQLVRQPELIFSTII